MCCVCCMSVVIQSNAGIPPLDEETILFLDNKIVLGKVLTFYHKLHSVHEHIAIANSLTVAYYYMCRFWFFYLPFEWVCLLWFCYITVEWNDLV